MITKLRLKVHSKTLSLKKWEMLYNEVQSATSFLFLQWSIAIGLNLEVKVHGETKKKKKEQKKTTPGGRLPKTGPPLHLPLAGGV